MSNELSEKLKTVPQRPGVYLFKDFQGKVLYVGKALSLRARLSSYFQTPDRAKVMEMMHHAQDFSYIETGSEFTALLLEARLIKLYLPKYNTALRDDKSYLYVFISTGETFPKIFLTRKPKTQSTVYDGLKGEFFGPFPSSFTLKKILRWLRRMFPYCAQKSLGKRPCFYSHLGLCRPCPSWVVKQTPDQAKIFTKEYRINILRIKRIFEGKSDMVKKDLEKEMKKYSSQKKYEEAAVCRNRYLSLEKLLSARDKTAVFLENPNYYYEAQEKKIIELQNILSPFIPKIKRLHRIECFDVSTIQGKFSVASQVVFIDGLPEKSLYRRFRMRVSGKPDDVGMLKEAVFRRLKHQEWPLPHLLVIDGGKAQIAVIDEGLKELNLNLPLIGLAKRLETIVVKINEQFHEVNLPKKSRALQLLQQIRDEAHRFAITYHRKLRAKSLA